MTSEIGEAWFLRIGDPTVSGWTCVVLYAIAVIAASHALRGVFVKSETCWLRAYWIVVIAILVLLGANKQLDLQVWILQSSMSGVWSGKRAVAILGLVCTLCGVATCVARYALPDILQMWRSVHVSLLGVLFLVGTIAYRSLNLPGSRLLMLHVFHVDHGPWNVHLKELVEIAALITIAAGGWSAAAVTVRRDLKESVYGNAQ